MYNLPLSVWMRSRYHLWKINDSRPVLGVQDNVELVKVAVDEAKASQLYYQLHEYTVQRGGVSHAVHLSAVWVVRGKERGGGGES